MTQAMLAVGTPKPARYLLAVAVASFLFVLLRDGFGVGFPLWEAGWGKTYNPFESLGCRRCALRVLRARGHEPAAWLALALGLFGFFACDASRKTVITPMQ